MQHIGEQAGIEPARIARAAQKLDNRVSPTTVRRSLGLPVGVSRVVELPRAPTDREWEVLISEFRTTFETHGQATTSGGMREWSRGKLHISVEPTARGYQLRLTDTKEDAVAISGLGYFLSAFAVLMGSVVAAAGQPRKGLLVFAAFGGLALLAFLAANLVRTPMWARDRERHFEEIAERAVRLLSER